MTAKQKPLRIGCASGFWGDSALSAAQLVTLGDIDVLVFDYLAEVTMSILARAKKADETLGYAVDFVSVTMQEILPDIASKRIKIVSNAGGLNPLACKAALEKIITEAGLALTVAAITGDDVLNLFQSGTAEVAAGMDLPPLISANAYLGAIPIAKAFSLGADIVITGRCVDSALVLGPCLHAFGWKAHEHDKLAGASIAGHVIECGAQATGGNFTDWDQVPDWANIGYPIVEMEADGTFTVTKPVGTGGLVSFGTICEQLLYEVGDPAAYMLPDVICDITHVRVEDQGSNRVRVSGVRGRPPGDQYKVSATYQDGYRVGMYICIAGREADRKAQRLAEETLGRMHKVFADRNMPDFTETSVELIGTEAAFGPNKRLGAPCREVVLKLAAKHPQSKALAMLIREATSSATSMTPGIHGLGGLRPKPAPLVRLLTLFIPKDQVAIYCHVGQQETVTVGVPRYKRISSTDPATDSPVPLVPCDQLSVCDREVPLTELAWGRSGDKGNDANIGIIARRPEYLPYLRLTLTEDHIARVFAHVLGGMVKRYDLPGIHALNFVLPDSLGGGGMASLRNDPQGKTFAQVLLSTPVHIPADLLARN